MLVGIPALADTRRTAMVHRFSFVRLRIARVRIAHSSAHRRHAPATSIPHDLGAGEASTPVTGIARFGQTGDLVQQPQVDDGTPRSRIR
jgi:hypothetical protein